MQPRCALPRHPSTCRTTIPPGSSFNKTARTTRPRELVRDRAVDPDESAAHRQGAEIEVAGAPRIALAQIGMHEERRRAGVAVATLGREPPSHGRCRLLLLRAEQKRGARARVESEGPTLRDERG